MSATASGLVTGAWRRHFAVRLDDGNTISCVLRGRTLGVACGDRVRVVPSAGGDGAIEAIEARGTLLFRSDAHRQKLLAANVTQVLGIVAPVPPYDDELVQRWIIAAESNGCRFALIANKRDLPGFAALAPRLDACRALGYPVIPLCARGAPADLAPVHELVAGQRSALVGQSGMGKSTLINALLPGSGARVGEVSAALRAGRHTTSETTLYVLGPDSWIVDSPGMKEFGLAHLETAAIAQGFVDLRPFVGRCRFRDCRHGAEPGCAVQEAVVRGEVKPWRVALLQRLLGESETRARSWSR
ncbi:MAG TPA: ribosome small subunit-dependent GTPase A [Casimicrobiaceae bacterium]|nr:ribosome small subunit-dependent GTPase A [Casimicrobiaceae bacterium]